MSLWYITINSFKLNFQFKRIGKSGYKMSTESKTEYINIYLRDQETKSAVISDLSAERKYIILQNDTLQAENKNLNNKIVELENHIEELETDSAKMERSSTYIKGMLKNFVEVDRLYRKIDSNNTQLESKMNKIIKDMNESLIKELLRYKVVSILFFIICFFIGHKYSAYTFFTFDQIFFIVLFSKYIYKTMKNTTVSESESVKETRTKINEIHKAQDYIVELIDNC